MTDTCGCPPEAGNAVCELPAVDHNRLPLPDSVCPRCGEKGKPVQGQTVKAILSVSLRTFQDTEYRFCKTQDCPVVYFSVDDGEPFTVNQLRERVYQKEPENDEVHVCYCFRHTVGDIRNSSKESQTIIVEDITAGINVGQCACDLRNPQGSCCLGNVRALIKQIEARTVGEV